jgi:hypothetical protein
MLIEHGIEPALNKGIATQQPPKREIQSARGAMTRDGFRGVVGARRVKPASSSEKWREESNVEADEQK